MTTLLMTLPDNFSVDYCINDWMISNIGQVNTYKAIQQWNTLYEKLSKVCKVELIQSRQTLPDMVFTANAGFIKDNIAFVSRFKHLERQGEEVHFQKQFKQMGFTTLRVLSGDFAFEGAGDCLTDAYNATWIGYGQRTLESSAVTLINYFSDKNNEWYPLELVSGSFYHLDTCFCPLSRGHILWYPEAFTKPAQMLIRAVDKIRHQKTMLIEVSDTDARQFACNAVNIDRNIYTNLISNELTQTLNNCGYIVHSMDLSEYMKSGGSAKCLTLKIN